MNRRNKRLEFEDYEWLRERCPSCSEVGAQLQNRVDLKREGQDLFGTMIAGVTANMGSIEDKTIAEGRYILPTEVESAAMVCVIGWDVKEKFFPSVDAIGKRLSVRGIPLEIVGIEEKRGSMFGQSFDNLMYVPLTTYRKIFGGRQSLQIHGKTSTREQFQSAIDDARLALRNKHKLKGTEADDFGLVNTGEIGNEVDSITGGIAMVVTPITFISLVVGGIVVMNLLHPFVAHRLKRHRHGGRRLPGLQSLSARPDSRTHEELKSRQSSTVNRQ
ncbi:MAG: ABC transporter permease [Acidobacteria bacterium]|nr:ABC transporter permease [Acidobacteriota bacterium]